MTSGNKLGQYYWPMGGGDKRINSLTPDTLYCHMVSQNLVSTSSSNGLMHYGLMAPGHYLSQCWLTGVDLSLTHWGLVTHLCISKLTITGLDNGLSPGRRQAIIWTNAGILLFRPLETKFSEILIEIRTFSFKKMHLKMSSAKWQPFCLSLHVLIKSSGVHLRTIL